MGRKNKKRKHQQHQQQHISGESGRVKKKYKKRRIAANQYWIEKCQEIRPSPEIQEALTLTISRVDLSDHHTHGPTEQKAVSETDDKKDEKKSRPKEKKKSTEDETDETIDGIKTCQEKAASNIPSLDKKKERRNLSDEEIRNAFIAIHRSLSAKEPKKVFPHQNFQPLENGDKGDGITNPHDKSQVPDKYWAQRKRFFSRFDDGIRLDSEGWYSITPEAIANHIAKKLSSTGGKDLVVLDAFCGCGGNAIAFARAKNVRLVIAVDTSMERLQMAAHNASVYEIPKDRIIFIHANACLVLESYENGRLKVEQVDPPSPDVHCGYTIGGVQLLAKKIDSIFLSPPWGGMDYESAGRNKYHIETCIEVESHTDKKWSGEDILVSAGKATTGQVSYFLPRNINGISFGRSAVKAGYNSAELEVNMLNSKLKTVTAYLPGF